MPGRVKKTRQNKKLEPGSDEIRTDKARMRRTAQNAACIPKNARANNSTKQRTKKKGPLALASGPSLGRKRPRRAAIAQGATAPQQYATALHKTQVLLMHFACKICRPCTRATHRRLQIFSSNFNILDRTSTGRINHRRSALDFVIGAVTKNAPLFGLSLHPKCQQALRIIGRIKVRPLPDWDRQ